MSQQTPYNKVGAVILAAGRGTRLKSVDTPKVMLPIGGKPMVSYIVDTLKSIGFTREQICLVVGFAKEKVMDYFGESVTYAMQEEQLGTGHAVGMAENALKNKVKDIVVLYGDMPLITAGSIERLIVHHQEQGSTVTLMTVTVPDFEGHNTPFKSFGRIVRDASDGRIVRIVEQKDCNSEELKIMEVNPFYICFRADWLWQHVKHIKNNNVQKEYYLNDLIDRAIDGGEKISSINVDSKQAIGINTPEDLVLAKGVLNK